MSEDRHRARELGIVVGRHEVGRYNAITDVPGVRVGHVTLVEGESIRTGVTAVVPAGVSPSAPLPAGLAIANGYGKLIGATQLDELGVLETPIVLTATLCAFRAADALVSWVLAADPEVVSVNPVVGECNDGYLSDIRARPVAEHQVLAAIDGARSGPVDQGCVGAGTGTAALGFKAGIGTSSRRVALPSRAGAPPAATAGDGSARGYTIGVLVQANFGGVLRLGGRLVPPEPVGEPASPADDGSCMIIVATDAPLDARQLGRLARRGVYALGRVGAAYGHGSGDYAIAFSTVRDGRSPADADLSVLFEAVLDAVEEAVLDSLFLATTTTGYRGHVKHALPLDRVGPLLANPPGA